MQGQSGLSSYVSFGSLPESDSWCCPQEAEYCKHAVPDNLLFRQVKDRHATAPYVASTCTATNPAPSPIMSQQLSLHRYSAGLQTAEAVQQKAVKASPTNHNAVVTELISWLHSLNMLTKSMQTGCGIKGLNEAGCRPQSGVLPALQLCRRIQPWVL